MTLIPQRTVFAQVAAQLEAEILAGEWHEWLPGERELAQRLHVSRSSLRLALAQLVRSGVTEPVHGIGHRIIAAQRPADRRALRSVGLLTPESLEPLARLRPNVATWIEDFQDRLTRLGCAHRIHHGQEYYRRASPRALQALVRRERHEVWVVVLASETMQRWFMENEIPCVVAGSCHRGIELPSVDLDYHGLCRHAAAELFRRGHRKICLLGRRSAQAGDLAGEQGFLEIAAHGAADLEASIAHHENTVATVAATVRRLFRQSEPPTGLLVSNSNWYLTVVTTLAELGRRVPQDVSLISRNDDPFLDFIVPSPARYRNDPHLFAKRILTLVLRYFDRQPVPQRHIRLVPRFDAGASLGGVPVR